jgi:hypothetical protein
LATSTEASALATAPVAVRGARLALAPRTDEATLLVRAAGLAAAAAADVEDAVAQTLDMFVGDETCEGSDAVYDAHTRRARGARGEWVGTIVQRRLETRYPPLGNRIALRGLRDSLTGLAYDAARALVIKTLTRERLYVM